MWRVAQRRAHHVDGDVPPALCRARVILHVRSTLRDMTGTSCGIGRRTPNRSRTACEVLRPAKWRARVIIVCAVSEVLPVSLRRQDGNRPWIDGWPSLLSVFALAGTLALVAVVLGWRGSDLPAQVFRTELIRRDGFALWNSQWFGGHTTLTYSVLAPMIATITGPIALGAFSGVASAVLFERILRFAFGRTAWLGAVWFALGTVANFIVGRVTFGVGVTFALAAVCALQRRHPVIAVACSLLASLCSPLAGLFLALAGAAWALAQPARRVGRDRRCHQCVVADRARGSAVPAPGRPALRAVGTRVGSGMCARRRARVVAPRPAAAMGRVAVHARGSAVLARALGGRRQLQPVGAVPRGSVAGMHAAHRSPACVARCARDSARDLAVLSRCRRHCLCPHRPVDQAFVLHAADRVPASRDRADQSRRDPVDIPPLGGCVRRADNAARRGWERQLDMQYDPIFYDQPLTRESYHEWLTENGVQFVALPDTRLDDSSLGERALLGRGAPYLQQVWRDEHWRVWRVKDFSGLVTGDARLLRLTPQGFTLDMEHAGDVTVHVARDAPLARRGRGVCRRDRRRLDRAPRLAGGHRRGDAGAEQRHGVPGALSPRTPRHPSPSREDRDSHARRRPSRAMQESEFVPRARLLAALALVVAVGALVAVTLAGRRRRQQEGRGATVGDDACLAVGGEHDHGATDHDHDDDSARSRAHVCADARADDQPAHLTEVGRGDRNRSGLRPEHDVHAHDHGVRP